MVDVTSSSTALVIFYIMSLFFCCNGRNTLQ